MIGHEVPTTPPDPELVRSLRLSVRKLPHRRNRWAWDLTDSRDGSWFESMLEFGSPAHARRSGLSRLEELAGSVAGPEPVIFLEAA
jgi:hypothetical protein